MTVQLSEKGQVAFVEAKFGQALVVFKSSKLKSVKGIIRLVEIVRPV